jgi:Protein of unknown function (DUF2795)
MDSSSSKRENVEQIPNEDDTQGKTGRVISEQAGVEGQRKEVNVESYSDVAELGQVLKDIEFPASKNKIIERIKQGSNVRNKVEILEKLERLEDREYKNVSEVTAAAGLIH